MRLEDHQPKPRQSKGAFWTERLPSAFLFFAIAAFFLKFLWWDTIQRIETHASWTPIVATVESAQVGLGLNADEYELGVVFEGEIDGAVERFKCFINSGQKGQMNRIKETEYAPGSEITLYINPHNWEEFSLRREKSRGAWFIGMGGSLLFGLIGLSVLLYGRSVENMEPET